jgi:hypothetical protein
MEHSQKIGLDYYNCTILVSSREYSKSIIQIYKKRSYCLFSLRMEMSFVDNYNNNVISKLTERFSSVHIY